MKMPVSSQILCAACIGIFYSWMLVNFWGSYSLNNPINEWLLDILAKRGYEELYLVGIHTHDVIMNVLLAAPIAAIFVVFHSLNRWPILLVAVASGVIFTFRNTDWSLLHLAFDSWRFWFGLGVSAFSLPIAFASIRTFPWKRATTAALAAASDPQEE